MTGTLLWLTQNHFPQPGGMAQSCDRIVSGLRRRGWTIDLVHISRKWTRLESRRRLGGFDIECPQEADASHMLNRLWCALPQLGSGHYCAVVAFGGALPMLAGPVFSAWLQKPLLTLIRGNDFDAAVFDPKRAGVLERAVRASARVAAVSQDKVSKIQRLWPGVAVEWIGNGIDLDNWHPIGTEQEQAARLRTTLTGDSSRKIFGLFGHIKRKKGADYFIEALQRSGRADAIQLLIVGDMEPSLVEKLQQQDAAKPALHFSHFPFTDRYALLPYYLACDYICIPSYYDGMPNVMLEAVALGKPLLASQVGGMADMLHSGHHGFLFAAGQIDACASAINQCFHATDTQYQEMSDACMLLAAEQLNARAELDRYEQLLGSITDLEHKLTHLEVT